MGRVFLAVGGFILIEVILMLIFLPYIRTWAETRNQPPFSWRLRAAAAMILAGLGAGLLALAVFPMLEIGLIWSYLPVIPASLLAYLWVKSRLKRVEKS